MENESRLVDTLHAVPAVGEDYNDSGSFMAAIGSPEPSTSSSGHNFNTHKPNSRITYVRGNVLQRLVADVLAEWKAYPAAQLDKMWDVKSWCFEQTIAASGWNTYERHRTAEAKAEHAEKRCRRIETAS